MADGENVVEWPTEEIPDADTIYLRVHKQNRDKAGDPNGKAFSPQPLGATGLSANWSRYADAVLTRVQVRQLLNKAGQPKDPKDYGVVSLEAGKIRAIDSLSVIHDPVRIAPLNRAHTEIRDIKPGDAEIRVLLGRIFCWCIQVEDAVQEAA